MSFKNEYKRFAATSLDQTERTADPTDKLSRLIGQRRRLIWLNKQIGW